MAYKRKYAKIVVDNVVGAVMGNENVDDIIIAHREIKGMAIKKSHTDGVQEAIDMAFKGIMGNVELHAPQRKGDEK